MLRKVQMYVWGVPFVLEIDSSSLIKMVISPNPLLNAAMNQGIAFLHLFDLRVRHVPGNKRLLPDALSRVGRDEVDSSAVDADDMVSLGIELASSTLTRRPLPSACRRIRCGQLG